MPFPGGTLRSPQRVSSGEVHLKWGTVSSGNNTVVLYREKQKDQKATAVWINGNRSPNALGVQPQGAVTIVATQGPAFL